MSKPTKKDVTASRHPAFENAPRIVPASDDDGFSGHVAQQRKKLLEERDGVKGDKSE
jgi:hypothetical protein